MGLYLLNSTYYHLIRYVICLPLHAKLPLIQDFLTFSALGNMCSK